MRINLRRSLSFYDTVRQPENLVEFERFVRLLLVPVAPGMTAPADEAAKFKRGTRGQVFVSQLLHRNVGFVNVGAQQRQLPRDLIVIDRTGLPGHIEASLL